MGNPSLGLAHLPAPEVPASPIASEVAALLTEAGLGTILDGIGNGFYAVDRDWRLILFNSEAARHFRCKPEDVLGRVLWDAFPGTRDSGLARLFHSVMASREAIRSETESIVVKGRWMAYRLFPLGDGLGVVFRDTTDRRIAEEQRDLLMKELEHRVKNTLTTVQSIASQSFRAAGIAPEALRAFDARLIALGNVHGVLTKQSWDAADLHDVVWAALRPHSAPDRDRFTVEGPHIQVGPKCAVAFSRAGQGLPTKPTRAGGLSADSGHV